MLLNFEQLNNIRKNNLDKKIAVCTGTFDLFHYSHLMFLKYVKEHSDILLVVVKSDKDVRAKGDNRPIINEYERAMIVDNIKYVDYTIISDELHHTKKVDEFIKVNTLSEKEKYRLLRDGTIFDEANVDSLFVTDDKKKSTIMENFCNEMQIKMETIPIQGNDFHTSDIIKKIRK